MYRFDVDLLTHISVCTQYLARPHLQLPDLVSDLFQSFTPHPLTFINLNPYLTFFSFLFFHMSFSSLFITKS
jgi:hypothetical protein